MYQKLKANGIKIFVKFLLSYVLVLVIPLSLASLAYREAVITIEKNVIRYNLSVLEQSRDVIEQRLNEIENLVLQFGLNPNVMSMMNVERLDQGSPDIYKFWSFNREMQPHRYTNNYIADFFLYFRNSNTVVSPEFVHTRLDLMYEDFLSYENMTLEEWKSLYLDQWYNSEYMPAQKVSLNKKSYSIVTYVQSLPLNMPQTNMGTMLVLLNEEEIINLLKPLKTYNRGWAYIADNEQGILSSFRTDNGDVQLIDIGTEEHEGFIRMDIDGESMIVSYITSEWNGWKYVTAVPWEEVMSEVNNLRDIISLFTVVSILVGILAAIYLANRNSTPIRRLVTTISEAFGIDKQRHKNEYDFLNGSVNELVKNNQNMKSILDEQTAILQNAFFDRLLKGDFSTKGQMDAMMSHSNLQITGNQFCIVIIQIHDYDKHTSRENVEKLGFIRILVKDTLLKHSKKNDHAYFVDENKIAVLLCGLSEDPDEFSDEIKNVIKNSTEELANKYKIKINHAVGGIHKNLIDVTHSFNEAKQTMEYYMVKGDGDITWFKDIPTTGEEYYYPIHVESRLIGLVKAGDRETAKEVLNSVYCENFLNRKLTLDMLQLLLFDMKGTIVKLIEQLKVDYSLESLAASVDSLDKADRIFEEIVAACETLCTVVLTHQTNSMESQKKGVLDYINSHFTDSSLCINSVATRFGYSESYLYQFFKDLAGMTFSDYLENLRMKQACTLLEETELTVKEISEKVGYNNDHSFRRAFKRCHGMGPSEFRLMQKNDLALADER